MKLDINKILRADWRSSSRGAPMGDTDMTPDNDDWSRPLRCQRVNFVDGDYAPDGTYWGRSDSAGPIYCAFNDGRDGDEYEPAMGVRLYTRAFTYEQAKATFKKTYPEIKFLRGGR